MLNFRWLNRNESNVIFTNASLLNINNSKDIHFINRDAINYNKNLVIEILKSNDLEYKIYALEASKYIRGNPEKLVSVLIDLLQQPDSNIRLKALTRLTRDSNKELGERALDVLKDETDAIILNKIESLKDKINSRDIPIEGSFMPRTLGYPVEIGDPVYRELGIIWGWVFDYNHTAIYYGFTPDGTDSVIEGNGIQDSVGYAPFSTMYNFGNGYDYFGAYNLNNESLTFGDRQNIRSTASLLVSAQIEYPDFFPLITFPEALVYIPSTVDSIEIGEIEALRCDGVVEYTYEVNGFDIWDNNLFAGDHFDISHSTDWADEHNNPPDWNQNCESELSPLAQRNACADSHTNLTETAVTSPPSMSYNHQPSSNQVTINATDLLSGIYSIEWKIGDSNWESSPIQENYPASNSQSVAITLNQSDSVYVRSTDNAGNVFNGIPFYIDIFDDPVPANYFSYRNMIIEPSGDHDPVVESGEDIDLKVEIRNDSYSEQLYYIDAILYTNNENITISDNDYYYGNFEPRESKMSDYWFDWFSDPSFSGDVYFSLYLEYEDGNGTSYYETVDLPAIHVYEDGSIGPNFSVVDNQTLYFDNNSLGNSDGILQSGENYIRYALKLLNDGTGQAYDIEVQVLESAPFGVGFGDVTVDYPNLDPNESSYQVQDDTLSINISSSFSGQLYLDMDVEYNEGDIQTIPFVLDVVPAPWINLSQYSFNFGQVEPGIIETTITIQNQGTAVLTISQMSFDPNITITNLTTPFDIQPGESIEAFIRLNAMDLNGFITREIIFTSNTHLEQQEIFTMFGTIYSGPVPEFDLTLLDQFDIKNGEDPDEIYDDPNNLTVGDFDGDGMNEIAIVTDQYYYSGHPEWIPSFLLIFDFIGGEWTKVYYDNLDGFVDDVNNLSSTDLDNDEIDEIVICMNEVLIYDYNDNDGYFIANTISGDSFYNDGLTVGDIDNDNHKEIVFFERSYQQQSKIVVFEQTSGLSFSQIWSSENLHEYNEPDDLVNHIAGLNIADSDNDGNKEILFMADYGQVFIYEYVNGNFELSFHLHEDAWNSNDTWDCYEESDMKVGDTDNDGLSELLICSEDRHRLYIIETTGNNSYNIENPVIIENINYRWWIELGDLNNNGFEEIYLFGETEPWLYVLENYADNSYTQIYSSPSYPLYQYVYVGIIDNLLPDDENHKELVIIDNAFIPPFDYIPIFGFSSSLLDLIIPDASLQVEGMLEENSNISIHYDIMSFGDTDLDNVLVKIYDNSPDSSYSNIIDEFTIPQILGGQTWSDSTLWIPVLEGNYNIHVMIDPDDAIQEEDESNNIANEEVYIADDDTEGPEITDVYIVEYNGNDDGIIESSEEVLISCSVVDASGVNDIQFNVDNVSVPLSGEYYVICGPYEEGTHIVSIIAIDNDNSQELTVVTESFTIRILEPVLGDVNFDGVVDILDIVLVVDVIMTGSSFISEGDMNSDGANDILDIVMLVDYILNP